MLVGEQRNLSIRDIQMRIAASAQLRIAHFVECDDLRLEHDRAVLEALGGNLARNCFLVLNRYDPLVQGFTVKDLQALMKLPRVFTVRNDAAVHEALNNGRTLRMQNAKSGVLDDLDVLAQALLGREKPPLAAPHSPNLLGRFCHAIGLS